MSSRQSEIHTDWIEGCISYAYSSHLSWVDWSHNYTLNIFILHMERNKRTETSLTNTLNSKVLQPHCILIPWPFQILWQLHCSKTHRIVTNVLIVLTYFFYWLSVVQNGIVRLHNNRLRSTQYRETFKLHWFSETSLHIEEFCNSHSCYTRGIYWTHCNRLKCSEKTKISRGEWNEDYRMEDICSVVWLTAWYWDTRLRNSFNI